MARARAIARARAVESSWCCTVGVCLLRSVRRPHPRASRDAPIGWGSAMNLDVDPFQSWVDRSWARAREIA